ncbi:hypothetical protein L596_005943 [Steinernema carpocapsae]|uniref:MADF domain-containing protein n=3 Tax=Steinernema carpocapsae TaxID=34508 RepID=A0A4U8V0L4_STECR|nr:hypothetical protein L596_005943 [Steinernema carpocapsae]
MDVTQAIPTCVHDRLFSQTATDKIKYMTYPYDSSDIDNDFLFEVISEMKKHECLRGYTYNGGQVRQRSEAWEKVAEALRIRFPDRRLNAVSFIPVKVYLLRRFCFKRGLDGVLGEKLKDLWGLKTPLQLSTFLKLWDEDSLDSQMIGKNRYIKSYQTKNRPYDKSRKLNHRQVNLIPPVLLAAPNLKTSRSRVDKQSVDCEVSNIEAATEAATPFLGHFSKNVAEESFAEFAASRTESSIQTLLRLSAQVSQASEATPPTSPA